MSKLNITEHRVAFISTDAYVHIDRAEEDILEMLQAVVIMLQLLLQFRRMQPI